jgi:hypothetical protein
VTRVDPCLERVPETLLWGIAALPVPLPPRPGAGYGFAVPLATRLPFARTALLSIWAARIGPLNRNSTEGTFSPS